MAGIEDENAALDFDLACTVRLNQWDISNCEMQAKLIAYEVSKLFGGGDEGDENQLNLPC